MNHCFLTVIGLKGQSKNASCKQIKIQTNKQTNKQTQKAEGKMAQTIKNVKILFLFDNGNGHGQLFFLFHYGSCLSN